jgi:hypothetical protein
MGDVEYVLVVRDAEAAHEVSAALGELDGGGREVAEIQGLGGSITDWMIAGSVAAHVVSSLLKAVYPFVEGRRIKSIKAGDVEIMYPRPEDVTKVLDLHFAKDQDQPNTDR